MEYISKLMVAWLSICGLNVLKLGKRVKCILTHLQSFDEVGSGPVLTTFYSYQCISQRDVPTGLHRESIGPERAQLLLDGVLTSISKNTYSHL